MTAPVGQSMSRPPWWESPYNLTAEQAARVLGLPSVQALRDLHSRHGGPPRVRLSPSRWAYRPIDLYRWMEERIEQPASTGKRSR